MEDLPRIRKRKRETKVNRIPRGYNMLIVTDMKCERKANMSHRVEKIR